MSGMGRVLKIVAVGDGAVGKTSLLLAYTQGVFDPQYIPTVFENYAGDIELDGKKYNFTLWDTAGQEGFDRCRVLCYQGASVFLVCFSIDNPNSLENVRQVWLPEVRKECGDTVPTLLVGTKSDLRNSSQATNTVKAAEGRKVAKSLKMAGYVECSAKELNNLKQVFSEAVQATEPNHSKGFSCVIL
ncbi:ras-related protein ced-10-like [Macrobrachium rosenbergii]|uniref:ras-related protein ced-10-like n=1 Tax=Macrobrachium rosenbergii TaxID=79674 RepID=UPI0034D5C8CA